MACTCKHAIMPTLVPDTSDYASSLHDLPFANMQCLLALAISETSKKRQNNSVSLLCADSLLGVQHGPS